MNSNVIGKVTVSNHANDRATEHFRISRDKAAAWVIDNVRKATFISDITSDEGKPCRLYGFQRIAYVLDAAADHVITLYPQNYAVTSVQRKVNAIVRRELEKAERKERAVERHTRVEKAKLAVEIAQCKLRMEITPSKAVVARNNVILAQINAKVADLDTALQAARREKTSYAKSLLMYV